MYVGLRSSFVSWFLAIAYDFLLTYCRRTMAVAFETIRSRADSSVLNTATRAPSKAH